MAILVSNPVLVSKNTDGTFGGVSVDLGRLIAAKLGARFQEVTYQTTETFAKSFSSGEWDVAVGAPDQYLGRILKSASLVRIAGATPEIVEALRAGKADVYGSNAENVHAAAASLPGSKILPGAFRTVNMVVAYPKGKSQAARETIERLVSEAKSSGLVGKAIASRGLKGVRVAE